MITLAWFGGYPAHYMAELHRQLEYAHSDICYVYTPFGSEGPAFSHETSSLPKNYKILSRKFGLFKVWGLLKKLNPRAVLIAGSYPRSNLIALLWALCHGRDLYYLSDSNSVDKKNDNKNFLKVFLLKCLMRCPTKFLSIGTRNTEYYQSYRASLSLTKDILFFPLPHLNKPFESVKNLIHDPFVFLYFGRLDETKAIDRIISAFAILMQSTDCSIRLLIAGDGPKRAALEKQVEALGLQREIEFRGLIASDKAPEIFAEASALVVASHSEPWGLVVNEALSAGKPVIGPFWVGSFVDLVIPGKTGLVIDGNSPEQLSGAMLELIKDPLIAHAMGNAGRIHVREKGFTIERTLQEFSHLMIQLRGE